MHMTRHRPRKDISKDISQATSAQVMAAILDDEIWVAAPLQLSADTFLMTFKYPFDDTGNE